MIVGVRYTHTERDFVSMNMTMNTLSVSRHMQVMLYRMRQRIARSRPSGRAHSVEDGHNLHRRLPRLSPL